MKNNEKLTILVCSSDGYEDLWEPFFSLFNKFWPNCEYKILLNTESKSYKNNLINVDVLDQDFTGLNYGYRMIQHLEAIKTEYTLLLLDDFFIRESVNREKIVDLINFLDNNPLVATINFDELYREGSVNSNLHNYFLLPKVAKYKLNMQAGIWRTKVFQNLWRSEDNPWRWEIYGNYRTYSMDNDFLNVKSSKYSPINYGYNPEGMGVFRGKWVENDVVPLFLENNIQIDYSKRGFYDPLNVDRIIDNNLESVQYIYNTLGLTMFLSLLKFKLLKKAKFLKQYGTHEDYLNRKRDSENA